MGKKTRISLLVVLVLLVGLRIALPGLLLPVINRKLHEASKVVDVHIGDLGLSLFRGAYRFDDITLTSKVDASHPEIAQMASLDVSIAWRELIHGFILADAHVEGLKLTLGHRISVVNDSSSSDQKKTEAGNILKNVIPFDVSRLTLIDSKIYYHLTKSNKDILLVNSIEGRISDISNARHEKRPIPSLVSLKGNVFDGSSLTLTGEILPFRKPIAMALKAKCLGFHLKEANPFLLGVVPVSFAAGSLNAFAEARYESGDLKGYVKPFFHDVQLLSNPEHFLSLKHFFIEIGTAIGNLLLRNGATKTTAAVVEFSKPADGDFNIQISKIFSTAFHNGYVKALPEDFEDSKLSQLNIEPQGDTP